MNREEKLEKNYFGKIYAAFLKKYSIFRADLNMQENLQNVKNF